MIQTINLTRQKLWIFFLANVWQKWPCIIVQPLERDDLENQYERTTRDQYLNHICIYTRPFLPDIS